MPKPKHFDRPGFSGQLTREFSSIVWLDETERKRYYEIHDALVRAHDEARRLQAIRRNMIFRADTRRRYQARRGVDAPPA